ncbi:N,N-dimethylformamidase beta subunit family domain-containing protein [Streptomyces sp. NPDC020403]|uniref:N,N-dimethylformamidase beta subunit family domain-containing protein n=1 Tax=unclassified Streptomyces TaxID=2593676 RepID=UPI00340832E1
MRGYAGARGLVHDGDRSTARITYAGRVCVRFVERFTDNTCFRRIRLESGPGGEGRTVVCYKSDYQDDPLYPHRPALVTTDFRSAPAAAPESLVTGVLHDGYPTDAPTSSA